MINLKNRSPSRNEDDAGAHSLRKELREPCFELGQSVGNFPTLPTNPSESILILRVRSSQIVPDDIQLEVFVLVRRSNMGNQIFGVGQNEWSTKNSSQTNLQSHK